MSSSMASGQEGEDGVLHGVCAGELVVDVACEGQGGVGMEVEDVPVGVHAEERRVEAGVAVVV